MSLILLLKSLWHVPSGGQGERKWILVSHRQEKQGHRHVWLNCTEKRSLPTSIWRTLSKRGKHYLIFTALPLVRPSVAHQDAVPPLRKSDRLLWVWVIRCAWKYLQLLGKVLTLPMVFIGEILPRPLPSYTFLQLSGSYGSSSLFSTLLLYSEYLSLTGVEDSDSGGCRTQTLGFFGAKWYHVSIKTKAIFGTTEEYNVKDFKRLLNGQDPEYRCKTLI